MRIRKSVILQLLTFIFILMSSILYAMYLKGILDFRLVSPSDLNPYGGWSHLKGFFTDVSYRWRGVTKGISLSIGITVLSLMGGRFICGNICPIGSIQDLFNHIGIKLKLRQLKILNKKGLDLIKYIFLILVIFLSVIGFGYRLAPFSPWLGLLNLLSGNITLIGTIVLVIIAIVSLFTKRLFCRFLCPLGSYQSLVSAIGIHSIRTDAKCEGCNYCLRDCVVELKSGKNSQMPPECVACLRCVDSNCIKTKDGYKVYLGKKKLTENNYLLIGIIILVSIYTILPLAFSGNNSGWSMDSLDLQDGVYIGVGSGFGGRIMIDLEINNNRIESINSRSHNESSGYFEEVFRNHSREIIRNQNLNVDVISGATATSRGYLGAVRNALSQSMEQRVGE